MGLPDKKPGGRANRRLVLLLPLLEVLNLSVRLPKRLDLITVIITADRVENIAIGSLVRGGHTECLFASLPKLCPSLGEALLVIACAAHRAGLRLIIL